MGNYNDMILNNFIKEYQALIGSFIGLFFSVVFLYLKLHVEKKHKVENDKKEIEKIFSMAVRESEDIIKDLDMYISTVLSDLKIKKGGLNLFIPPKFNRIYINEERLFSLTKNLEFIISQQIDIAISSAKKLNNDLDQLENYPKFIYENTIKIIQSGLDTKEEAIENYVNDQEQYLKRIKDLLDGDFKIFQIHLFRPIVALAYGDRKLKKIPEAILDKKLDQSASLLVTALKQDLS